MPFDPIISRARWSASLAAIAKRAPILAAVLALPLLGLAPSTAAAAGGGRAAASSAQAASDFFGCPSGAVCIYRDGNPNHLSAAFITNEYFSYGAHNLVNQFNDHWVLNNQFGGPNATAVLCFGFGGTNCNGDIISPGVGFVENLTPINSIVLNRP
jgi:hypothetical protein